MTTFFYLEIIQKWKDHNYKQATINLYEKCTHCNSHRVLRGSSKDT